MVSHPLSAHFRSLASEMRRLKVLGHACSLCGALCLLLLSDVKAQTVYRSDSCAIRFFSRTPIENIEAVNHGGTSTISPPMYTAQFQVPVAEFRFENKMMEKHFNSMYLHTDDFPFASFRGKLSDSLDLSRDTVYQTKAVGILKMHGMDRAGSFDGRVESRGGKVYLNSTFRVRLEDFNIKVPGSVFLNIAQEIEIQVFFRYVAVPDE
jgi:hypothetical protein